MADAAPEWIQGPLADLFISHAAPDEQIQIYTTIASILLDPAVDGVNKFPLDYFPYAGENLRQCRDNKFLIIYRARPSGDIYVHQIFRVADLPDLRPPGSRP